MKIHIEYRNPTPMHCDVVVFINGANAGKLVLRQEEIVGFQQIVSGGCVKGIDTFLSSGRSQLKEEKILGYCKDEHCEGH